MTRFCFYCACAYWRTWVIILVYRNCSESLENFSKLFTLITGIWKYGSGLTLWEASWYRIRLKTNEDSGFWIRITAKKRMELSTLKAFSNIITDQIFLLFWCKPNSTVPVVNKLEKQWYGSKSAFNFVPPKLP